MNDDRIVERDRHYATHRCVLPGCCNGTRLISDGGSRKCESCGIWVKTSDLHLACSWIFDQVQYWARNRLLFVCPECLHNAVRSHVKRMILK